jgi:trehalose synthase-fused probable maltokinase
MASKTPPSDVLAAWLRSRRWFATKTRRIVAVDVDDLVPLPPGTMAIVRVRLDDGTADRYCLALGGRDGDTVADALDDAAFCRALLDLVSRAGRAEGHAGAMVGSTNASALSLPAPDVKVRRVDGEQSNSSVRFGDALILKLFRRLAEGVNPEAEMTRFLTGRAHFSNAPRLLGSLEYQARGGPTTTLAVVQALVPDACDGWEWMLDALARMLDHATAPPEPGRVESAAHDTLGMLRRLGEVTGRLHEALASTSDDPAFAPEPIAQADLDAWAEAVRTQVTAAADAAGDAEIVAGLAGVATGLAGLRGRCKIRHHGDLHLGQTLRRGGDGDVVIIDFEGEPLRPLSERRQKHAAVRDVAGVLRSIAYAAAASQARAATRPRGASPPPERGDVAAWTEAWEAAARREFIAGYRRATRGARFLPEGDEAFAGVVAVFELEKAAYEVVYEANNRPDWIAIPRRGLVRAASRLARLPAAGAA